MEVIQKETEWNNCTHQWMKMNWLTPTMQGVDYNDVEFQYTQRDRDKSFVLNPMPKTSEI